MKNKSRQTFLLEGVLRGLNLYESTTENAKRQRVLEKLTKIIKNWVHQVCLEKGMSAEIAKDAGAKIFTFGSFRLGVNPPGSDIDTLCVIPRNVERRDFFESLYQILQGHSEVSNLIAVPDAYVPLMKLYFDGVQIDLLCSRLSLSIIPEDFDILDPNNLRNIDDHSIRSLNGCRVADQILKLVPSLPNFRTTLICIKKWAQCRGIYSNVMGFLGGIAWALLVARICQLYPKVLPCTLVSLFFQFYSKWKWPLPILLSSIEEGGSLAQKVWNPRTNPKDRAHLMPIITPAYPSMNCTHNVSESTKRILLEEFERGCEITSAIDKQTKTWEDLFEAYRFWDKYNFYLRIDCLSTGEEQFRKWAAFVESRVRLLILSLERTNGVKYVHPHPEGIKFQDSQFPFSTAFFLGLSFNLSKTKSDGNSPKVNFTQAVIDFRLAINDWKEKTPNMEISVNCIKQVQLPDWVFGEQGRPVPLKKRKRKAQSTDSAKRHRQDSPSTPILKSAPITPSQTPSERSPSCSSSPSLNSSPTIPETPPILSPQSEVDNLPKEKNSEISAPALVALTNELQENHLSEESNEYDPCVPTSPLTLSSILETPTIHNEVPNTQIFEIANLNCLKQSNACLVSPPQFETYNAFYSNFSIVRGISNPPGVSWKETD